MKVSVNIFNMIIETVLLLALCESALSTIILHIRPNEFELRTFPSNEPLCSDSIESSGCQANVEICLQRVDSADCTHRSQFTYQPGLPLKVVNQSAIECRSVSGICIAIDQPTLIDLKMRVTLHSNPIGNPTIQRIYDFGLPGNSVYFNWSQLVLVGRNNNAEARLVISLMLGCHANAYGTSCQHTCVAPWRIYHNCWRNDRKLCHLRPIFNASCVPECSSNLSCIFPYEIRLRPATAAAVTSLPTDPIRQTDQIEGDFEITTNTVNGPDIPQETIVPAARGSDVGNTAWVLLMILIPAIVIVVIASPFILCYCNPARNRKREEKLERMKEIEEERDERWRVPEECADKEAEPGDMKDIALEEAESEC